MLAAQVHLHHERGTMSKPTTHVLLLVDDSASMFQVADSVRSSFNEYLDSLILDQDAKYRITVGIFGSEYRNLAIAQKPKDVIKLDRFTYQAQQGSTALYDSIARLIRDFDNKNPNLPKGDRVLLVIQTDGQDNSSHEVDLATARGMIEARQSGDVWNVLFLGAGMSGWKAGASLGVAERNLYQTQHSAQGYAESYSGVTMTSRATARGASKDEVAEVMRDALAGSDD
jgi:hypothetical protein